MDNPPTQEELEQAVIRDDLHKWGADGALEQLVEAGCDRGELERFLLRLRRALGTTRWSKADLKVEANRYARSAKKLLALKRWGEARNLDLSDDSERWLSDRASELEKLAKRLRERAGKAGKLDQQRCGRARARLIDYVQKQTATPQYEPLALLISAVTDKDHEPDSIRRWWVRNSEKFAAVLRPD